jgi:hypothetical protein
MKKFLIKKNMNKYALITTFYCKNCEEPNKDFLKSKFNFDGSVENIFLNFSNKFDPWNLEEIPNVGISKRKDLVFGKIFLLRKFVEDNILGKYTNIVHIDYSDTKFNRSCNEMVDKFIESGEEIILSTEKICWPYLEIVASWFNKKLEEKEFLYVNSGGIISKTEIFYKKLTELEKICLNTNLDFWDDQGVWQYYSIKYENITKDLTSEYFFSTASLDETYYEIENKIVKTKFGTKPFLIHDNSSFSLNLIKKI